MAETGTPHPPDLVFIVERDGIIRFHRPQDVLTPGDIVGTSIYDYAMPEAHEAVRSCLERVFETGEPDGVDLAGLRPRFAESWFEFRVAPNLRDGQVVSASVIARDVTPHKKLEAELRRELEALRRRVGEGSGSEAPVAEGDSSSSVGEDELRQIVLERDELRNRLADRTAVLSQLEDALFKEREEAAARLADLAAQQKHIEKTLIEERENLERLLKERAATIGQLDGELQFARAEATREVARVTAERTELEDKLAVMAAQYERQLTELQNERERVEEAYAQERRRLEEHLDQQIAAQADLQQRLREEQETLEQLRTGAALGSAQEITPPSELTRDQLEMIRFRSIMDQAGEAVILSDVKTGEIIDANETACKWLRHPREELMGMSVNDVDVGFPLQPPDLLDLNLTETRDLARPMVFDNGEHRRRDGSTFPVEVSITRLAYGTEDYVLAVARDIKGRKRAAEELQESEERYRSLFDYTRDAVYIITRAGEVEEANDSALGLFGYTREEFIGLDARRLYVDAGDIRRFQQQMANKGVILNFELLLKRRDDSQVKCSLTASLRRRGDGAIRGYQCIARKMPNRISDPKLESPPDAASEVIEQDASVLVVFDDEAVPAETSQVLERAGIRVLTARSGREAIDRFRVHHREIAAVLMGVPAGESSSESTFAEIRRIAPDKLVVIATGEPNEEVDEHVAEGGPVRYIPKPVHPLALIQHMREIEGLNWPHPPAPYAPS